MNRYTRAVHIDFHTPEGVEDFAGEFSAKEFADTLYSANVKRINAFARCNFGYSYYNTKIGVAYPTMKVEMFKDIVEQCHKKDITVSAYINIGINNVFADKHPEWCVINEKGSVYTGDVKENWAGRAMCYNTAYREHLLAEIEEIVQTTGADGIFCDCMGYAPCYCPACLSKMKEQAVNIKDNTEVVKFRFRSLLSLGEDIRKKVPKDKDLVFSLIPYDSAIALTGASHIEIESLPGGFGGWSHDYVGPMASYARNITEKTLYMTGRFHASWGDFGGIKEKASMENDLYDSLIYNVGIAIGDHMHPVYGLDKSLYKVIGEVFEKAKMYEKYTEGAKYCADIGIIRNKVSHSVPLLGREIYGSARMLTELGYGFDIINEDMDFSKYKILILPDCVAVNDIIKKKLKAHIKAGKGVISSAASCYDKENNSFVLDEYNFLEPCGLDNDTANCYKYTDKTLGDTSLNFSQYSMGVLIKAKNENEVVARRTGHYFADRWDRPYFDYRWTTEHLYTYLPPSKESGYASVVMHENICHIAFEIFGCYHTMAPVFHKRLVDTIIRKMLPNPTVLKTDLPSTAKVSLTQTQSCKLLNIKVTYPEPRGMYFKVVEEHNKLPQGARVRVLGNYKSALCIETNEELPIEPYGEYTQITLPKITGFTMIKIL